MKVVRLEVHRIFLEFLRQGTKRLEIRVSSDYVNRIEVDDLIEFNRALTKKVVNKRRYKDFDEMLKNHVLSEICPGLSRDQILAGLRAFYKPWQEQYGVLVFELADIKHN